MKKAIKYIILIAFMLSGYHAYAQTALNFVKYTYDQSGNRIERKMVSDLEVIETRSATLITAKLDEEEEIDSSYISEANKDFMFTNVEEHSIKIFPNPTKGKFAIEINPAPGNGSKVFLYDSNGKLIDKRRNISAIETFDLSDKRPGLYMLILKIGKKEYSLKVIRK